MSYENSTPRQVTGQENATEFERALAALNISPEFASNPWRAGHPWPPAVMFARAGHKVFPTAPDNPKQPRVKWLAAASTSPYTLATWQERFTDRDTGRSPNYALPTGREFGGLVVLDMDGEDGRQAIAQLSEMLGPLPERTLRVETGRPEGGEHVYMLCPTGEDELMNQAGVRGCHGLDVRGHHGFVTAPGSLNIKTGRRYRFADGCAPSDGCTIAVCPPSWWEWLPKKLFGDDGASAAPKRSTGTSTRSARVSRLHDRTSDLIGDGDGFGGFENPINLYAIRYFLRNGTRAPHWIVIDDLRELIREAPKGPGRQVDRYMSGDDLPRIVRRASEFVKSQVENEDRGFKYK